MSPAPGHRGGRGRPTGPAAKPRTGSGSPRREKRAAPPAEPVDVHDPDGIRLQKVLAKAGVGSRRACEEYIEAGRVSVDGTVVRELGVRVDPQRAVIHVDGVRVQLDETLVYLALNKPPGVLSTMHDEQHRPSLIDYVADRTERLFHVGRLDVDTEGLILLTNDGELAHRLAHPSYGVLKTYLAEVAGPVARDVGKRLKEGVELDDGTAAVDDFRLVDSVPGHALVEVVVHDGRHRIVRRLLEAVGHPVERLVRTQVGPIRLGELKPGRHRVLGRDEVGSLTTFVGL